MTTEKISLLAFAISIISLIFTIFYNHKTHERQKKQLTIETFNKLTEQLFDKEEKLLRKIHDTSTVFDFSDKNNQKEIKEILSAFERFCVGVNTNVFDIVILDKMAGSFIIDLYSDCYPYIKSRRENVRRLLAYTEIEQVVNKLNKGRSKSLKLYDKRGKI